MVELLAILSFCVLLLSSEIRSSSSSQPTVRGYRRPLSAVPACTQATHWQGNDLGMLLTPVPNTHGVLYSLNRPNVIHWVHVHCLFSVVTCAYLGESWLRKHEI